MKSRMRWMRTAVATLSTVALFGGPQLVAAAERCNRQDYYHGRGDRNSPNYDDRGYGYRSRHEGYLEYRDSGYRNGAYSNSYRDYGYRDYGNRNYSYPNNGSGYYDNGYPGYGYNDLRSSRSAGKSAAIIGGSAAAGALVGGLAGGGKGAAIGAAVGGIGGLIFDRATKDRSRSW